MRIQLPLVNITYTKDAASYWSWGDDGVLFIDSSEVKTIKPWGTLQFDSNEKNLGQECSILLLNNGEKYCIKMSTQKFLDICADKV